MRTIELGLLLELPDHLEDGTPAYWAGLMQDLIDNRLAQKTFTRIEVTVPLERKLWSALNVGMQTELITQVMQSMFDDSKDYAIDYLQGLDDEALQEMVDDIEQRGGSSAKDSG